MENVLSNIKAKKILEQRENTVIPKVDALQYYISKQMCVLGIPILFAENSRKLEILLFQFFHRQNHNLL